MKKCTIAVLALLFVSLLAAAQQTGNPASQQPTTPSQTTAPAAQQSTTPAAQPGMLPSSKAANPSPGPSAQSKTQKSSVGKGSLTVSTAKPVSFWQEQVTSAAGSVTTDFLYDPNVGVLYGYREDDFSCSNGQTAHGGILEALNTSNNKAGRPVGSGWWAVDLSGAKCGAKVSNLYGCRFDSNGNATECGAATINNATGEIDVVAVQ